MSTAKRFNLERAGRDKQFWMRRVITSHLDVPISTPGGAWRYCSEDDFTPAAPPSPPSLPTPAACACSEPETGCVSGDADVSSRCGCGTFGVSDTPFCYVLSSNCEEAYWSQSIDGARYIEHCTLLVANFTLEALHCKVLTEH